MKELIYSNLQLTRATGVPTMVVVEGVSIEMHKRGAATIKPAKAKSKKPCRPAKKASLPKEQSAQASKPAAARRAEVAPQ